MVSDIAGAPSSVGYWVGKLGLCLIAPLLLYVLGWTLRRIRGLTLDAVEALEKLLHANSEAAVVGAAKDILDRGGLKAAHRIEVDTEITVVRPW